VIPWHVTIQPLSGQGEELKVERVYIQSLNYNMQLIDLKSEEILGEIEAEQRFPSFDPDAITLTGRVVRWKKEGRAPRGRVTLQLAPADFSEVYRDLMPHLPDM
jgi:hypothetical protein